MHSRRKMMLVPKKDYGPRANCIGNAPGPVKCNKCGKCGKCSKCRKCSKRGKCAYLAVPHSSSPGGEQAGGKASTIDPGRGCTLVRTMPACGHQTGFSRLRRKSPRTAQEVTTNCAGDDASLRRKLPRTAQETTPACGHQTGFSSLRRKLPRTAQETTAACGHQTGFSRLRRKLPRTAQEVTTNCAGSYHELRRRRRQPAGTRPDSAGCAGSHHELRRRRRQPAKGYHEIVMAFRLPSAARPVSTPTTDKTTVPSAAGTTSSNTARYLSRPVPVHSFMP